MKISGILLPEYAAKLTLFNHLTSESEFYRNLREEKLLAHRGKGQAATGPNEVTGLGYYVPAVSGTWVVLMPVSDCGYPEP